MSFLFFMLNEMEGFTRLLHNFSISESEREFYFDK